MKKCKTVFKDKVVLFGGIGSVAIYSIYVLHLGLTKLMNIIHKDVATLKKECKQEHKR